MGWRKNSSGNKTIYIFPSKIRKYLKLPGHVIVFGKFDGRRMIHVWDRKYRSGLGVRVRVGA
jgi:hypothetical protein